LVLIGRSDFDDRRAESFSEPSDSEGFLVAHAGKPQQIGHIGESPDPAGGYALGDEGLDLVTVSNHPEGFVQSRNLELYPEAPLFQPGDRGVQVVCNRCIRFRSGERPQE